MHFSSLLLASVAGFASCTPLSTHVTHEKRGALPVAWDRHARASRDTILPVRIGLKQRNLEHADRFLQDVADPESPNFGTYYMSMTESGLNMIRKTLDRGSGCEHVCAASASFRVDFGMASRVWHRSQSSETFERSVSM